MSEVRSDNRLEQHPKPVQEYERRFNGTTWVDWADTAELEAVYNVAYRPNKYFWIDGDYFECLSDGVTYRQITGGGSGSGNCSVTSFTPVADASAITVSDLSGHTFFAAIVNVQAYTPDQVVQTGTVLDFSLVGGVLAGIAIIIFYV
jgi:hypothetical protein